MYRTAIAIIAVAVAGALASANADAQVNRGTGVGAAGQGQPSKLPPPKALPDARDADVPGSLGQVQANLGKLEDELRINAGQQKAWDAYATRVMRFADDVARARFAVRELEGTAVTAPQLFDRITENAQDRLDRDRGHCRSRPRALRQAVDGAAEDRGPAPRGIRDDARERCADAGGRP